MNSYSIKIVLGIVGIILVCVIAYVVFSKSAEDSNLIQDNSNIAKFNKTANNVSIEGCVRSLNEEIQKESKEFKPGEISVMFKDGIEGTEAYSVLRSYSLKMDKPILSPYTYFVEVVSGDVDSQVTVLQSSGLFSEVQRRLEGMTGEPSNVIYAKNNLNATKDQINTFIATKSNLKIQSVETTAVMGVVSVQTGTEVETACKLEAESVVELAFPSFLEKMID